MESTYLPILKRVGRVLLIVGVVDIVVMLYCIRNQISYSSSFNIFAIIGGLLLLRGSLRAASFIRWVALLMLGATGVLLVVWPFSQPLDLTYTQIRLNFRDIFNTSLFFLCTVCLLAWVAKELGREPILAARKIAGKKFRPARTPNLIGIGLVVIATVATKIFLSGEAAKKAKLMASQRFGSGYQFHVNSLNFTKNSQGTFVTSVVTAWNESEIRNIPVSWKE